MQKLVHGGVRYLKQEIFPSLERSVSADCCCQKRCLISCTIFPLLFRYIAGGKGRFTESG